MDLWRVELKFQGMCCNLVGKLPVEKRHYLKDFPTKLSVSMKAKYSAIPATSFFCKFASKDAAELIEYLKRKGMATCVTFPYYKYIFTLYLVVPSDLPQLKCLQRLKKTGANVESLCRDDDGVVIGVLNREINKAAEERIVQKQMQLKEAAMSARKLSTTMGDPLLEFDILLERLPTTKSAINICAQFMRKQKARYDDMWQRVVDAMESFDADKGRLNVVFLAHEVIRNVRGGTNDDRSNDALKASPLIRAGERIFHRLVDVLDTKYKDSTTVKEILALWTKWDVRFDGTEIEHPSMIASSADLSTDEIDVGLTDTTASSPSTGEVVVASTATSPEVVDLMRKHAITLGAWEIYLSRANADELYEIDHVLTLNENYATFLPATFDASSNDGGNRRYGADQFLHRYVKKNFKQLIDTHQTSVEPEQMRTSGEVLKEALVCTWEFDGEAQRSIYKSDDAFIDECWRKLEARMPCDNLNAYVMSYLKRCNQHLYSQNPDFVALSALSETGTASETHICAALLKVWPTMTDAAKAKLGEIGPEVARRVARVAVGACADGKPPHISRLILAEASKQDKVSKRRGKWWSPGMRSTIQEAYRRQAKRRPTDDVIEDPNTRPTQKPKTDTSPPPPELTDEELAALKARIPKPPQLKFHKVKTKDIQRIESNINGKLGMAISGIPNSGRGMFNLSEHAWPAFSVVCIFGSRRISEEMHHDGLNKVARCGEVGETFVVVNGEVKEVEKFMEQYGHRLIEYDGLVDAEGSMGGFPNDRVYEYPEEMYWDASGFYNNTILCPGCIVDPSKPESKIVLDQLYLVTWKEVEPLHEFFLAYGTSYYEDDDGSGSNSGESKKKAIKR
ncbi:Aste57867_24470 [Aphanomyces stellatus]|uniref:Aste57867_24470 protein n=1 Tax=Aphanomyces stellatus TaxID=120398 RepID=A0A485LUT6_9STRA|nr:hypothetical protein As57867_024393 [Aphanomyces stellatus]VFU01109.1 Aste57867_24470 [Aphanomyces stellatus]